MTDHEDMDRMCKPCPLQDAALRKRVEEFLEKLGPIEVMFVKEIVDAKHEWWVKDCQEAIEGFHDARGVITD